MLHEVLLDADAAPKSQAIHLLESLDEDMWNVFRFFNTVPNNAEIIIDSLKAALVEPPGLQQCQTLGLDRNQVVAGLNGKDVRDFVAGKLGDM